MSGVLVVQLIPAPEMYTEHLPRLRELAVAGLRMTGVRLGKVLDADSVVLEGMLVPTLPDLERPPDNRTTLRYTGYAYPAGQVPQ